MKFAKKYFAYMTVVAIGGGWLAMDYFSGSAAGESAASAAVITPSDNAGPKTAPLAADMGDEPAIAHRLASLSQSRHLLAKSTIDGFALPAAFMPAVTAPVASNVPHVTAANNFMGRHTLTSVMVAGHSSSVLVDGKTFLKMGDKIDGFILTAVTKNNAVFTSGSGASAVLGFNFTPTSTASIQGQ